MTEASGEQRAGVAVVTGGTRGIGLAVAKRLVADGYDVLLTYKGDTETADAAKSELAGSGRRVEIIAADISTADGAGAAIEAAMQGLGGLDVLVNNAGIQISRPTEELSSADFDRVLGVNLRGSFLAAREAVRHFLAAGAPASIVNVSSVHQVIPKPGYLGYSASKGGMQNLTRTLALEYAGRGIRVNGIGPGATVTPINRAWIDDPVKRAQVEEHIPMRRAGWAEEMAGVSCFLASELAAYITGQTIFVDGGLTLYPSFLSPWSSE
jgi:glucose 1-dehydrogenase